jgi:hypothetical protein
MRILSRIEAIGHSSLDCLGRINIMTLDATQLCLNHVQHYTIVSDSDTTVRILDLHGLFR